VLEKVGFTLEGIWRENTFEHGQFVSLKQYGLLRREYFQINTKAVI
jgi:RimJ/RimL family protein N-acetyltransferase